MADHKIKFVARGQTTVITLRSTVHRGKQTDRAGHIFIHRVVQHAKLRLHCGRCSRFGRHHFWHHGDELQKGNSKFSFSGKKHNAMLPVYINKFHYARRACFNNIENSFLLFFSSFLITELWFNSCPIFRWKTKGNSSGLARQLCRSGGFKFTVFCWVTAAARTSSAPLQRAFVPRWGKGLQRAAMTSALTPHEWDNFLWKQKQKQKQVYKDFCISHCDVRGRCQHLFCFVVLSFTHF